MSIRTRAGAGLLVLLLAAVPTAASEHDADHHGAPASAELSQLDPHTRRGGAAAVGRSRLPLRSVRAPRALGLPLPRRGPGTKGDGGASSRPRPLIAGRRGQRLPGRRRRLRGAQGKAGARVGTLEPGARRLAGVGRIDSGTHDGVRRGRRHRAPASPVPATGSQAPLTATAGRDPRVRMVVPAAGAAESIAAESARPTRDRPRGAGSRATRWLPCRRRTGTQRPPARARAAARWRGNKYGRPPTP